MAKKKENLTYKEALAQLEVIVHTIENESLDVDELSEKVKTALTLIDFCKTKLKNTEDTIKQAFDESDEE